MTEKMMEKREKRWCYLQYLAGCLVGAGIAYVAYKVGFKAGESVGASDTLVGIVAMDPELGGRVISLAKDSVMS